MNCRARILYAILNFLNKFALCVISIIFLQLQIFILKDQQMVGEM